MAHVGLRLIFPPNEEPLTLAEAKLWLRVEQDHTAEDDLITSLITESREKFELITALQLLTATWQLTLDGFPGSVPDEETGGVFDGDYILPPHPPLRQVTGIGYVDEDGVTQTWDSANYVVDTNHWPGRIGLADSVDWPDVLTTEPGSVTVTYAAGYDDADAVPQRIKGVIRNVLSFMYDNRGITKDTETLDKAIEALCRPYYMAHLF